MVVDDRTRLIAGSGFLTSFLFFLKTITYNYTVDLTATARDGCANRRDFSRYLPAVAVSRPAVESLSKK